MSNNADDEPPLPRGSHPTARAFFDALDTSGRNGKSSGKKKIVASSSSLIQQRAQSLGWRNRNSQADYYPISIADGDGHQYNFSVQQVQRGEVEGTYGTGATVWPAAMVLVKYMEKHQQELFGDNQKVRVIDLGSGTGVTSIAAALFGASHVVCTDGEENVVRLARDNVRHAQKMLLQKGQEEGNDKEVDSEDQDATIPIIAGCPICVEKYWWGTDEALDQVNLVIVADCVLPKLYPIAPLVQAIDECLLRLEDGKAASVPYPPAAILSYEHRYYPDYDPRDKFRELAIARGLQVHVLPMEEMDPVYKVEDIEIWRVTRKDP